MPHNINYQPSSPAVLPNEALPIEAASISGESSTPPASLNDYADGLMDDLFEEVEKVLAHGVISPLESPRSHPHPHNQPIAAPFVRQPPVELATAIADRQAQWQRDDGADTLMRQSQATLATLQSKSALNIFERCLIVVTCTSAIATLAVLAITQGWGNRLLAGLNPPPANTLAPSAPVDPVEKTSQFAQYMKRSLAAIDRIAANAPTGVSPNLPQVPVSAPTPVTTLTRPSLVPLPTVPVAANNKGNQNSSQSGAQNELSQILSRLSNILERLNFSINRTAQTPPPSGQTQGRPATTSRTAVTAVNPVLQRRLTGIYQAQDQTKSVVLFETNGVTQRYYIGESIGASGWSLIEVAKNSAVFRRNGEVLTLEQGQSLQ